MYPLVSPVRDQRLSFIVINGKTGDYGPKNPLPRLRRQSDRLKRR